MGAAVRHFSRGMSERIDETRNDDGAVAVLRLRVDRIDRRLGADAGVSGEFTRVVAEARTDG